jgi:DNA-binding GntR family transcriptional regulator
LFPGERIQDSALALALGVSRMPVREALLRLQSEGFVESSANRWIRVTAVSADQGEELYPVIWALECLALRLAAPALTSDDLATMDACNNRLRSAIGEGKGKAASEADSAFHMTFVSASGNTELIRIVSDLKLRLRRLEVAYFAGGLSAKSSVDEHNVILSALRKRNVDEAIAGVEANWRRSLERYRRQLESTPNRASAAPA